MPRRAKPKLTAVKIVAVDWYDAAGDSGWSPEAEARAQEPPLCTTVGTIIEDTKKKLVIAGTIGHGTHAALADVNVIPRGMIKAIAPLGEVLIEGQAPKKP